MLQNQIEVQIIAFLLTQGSGHPKHVLDHVLVTPLVFWYLVYLLEKPLVASKFFTCFQDETNKHF